MKVPLGEPSLSSKPECLSPRGVYHERMSLYSGHSSPRLKMGDSWLHTLNVVQGAVLAGASKIVAMDILDMKLAAAKIFGATHTLNAKRDDARQVILNLTEGRGADYVFVTVGSTTAVSQGITLLRRAGTLVIVGMPPSGATTPLPVVDIADNGLKILGSFVGSTRLRVDVPWLVDLYQQGRLKLDELITARYSLEQINEAIEMTERGEAICNLIVW